MNFLLVNGHHAMRLNLTLRLCILSCISWRIGESKPCAMYVMHFAIVNESAASRCADVMGQKDVAGQHTI